MESEVIATEIVQVEDDKMLLFTDDPEVIRAGEYLAMRDLNRTMNEIAKHFGYESRGGMYKLVDRWSKDGTLDKARQLYLMPKSEEIKASVSRVLDRWPRILERVVRTATHSRSDKTSLEAAAWLFEKIVKPAIDQQEEEGAAEGDYARRAGVFDPTKITIPGFLKPKD